MRKFAPLLAIIFACVILLVCFKLVTQFRWVKTDFDHFTLDLPPDMKRVELKVSKFAWSEGEEGRIYKGKSITIYSCYGCFGGVEREPYKIVMFDGKGARMTTSICEGKRPFC